MSEEVAAKNMWEKYKGKVVAIQLRAQPYIGITGDLEAASTENGFMSTPVVRGKVTDVEYVGAHTYLKLTTTDPDPNLPDNVVEILMDAERDVGYLTIIEKNLIRR